MARKPKSTDTEVENYSHGAARRLNIPTAENQSLVPDDDKAVKLLRYPRNPDLDPQLVWRGKDQEDSAPLEVAAPPIYIQEKIHPRALIGNLRRRSAARKKEAASQIDFFHDFNGLEADPEARTEFYAHAQNWQNRMILGDSLLVMGSLAEREALRGKVQCIYFDPPYGIKFNSNWQPSTKSRDVKDGKEDSVSREPEVVRAFRDTWKDGIHSYLSYLRERLVVARDLMADTGSVFVQIGDENVHIVRSLMDELFGAQNFCCQIQFQKTGSQESILLSKTVDYILWFSKNREKARYRQLYLEREAGDPSSDRYDNILLDGGNVRRLSKDELLRRIDLPSGLIFQHTSLISDGKTSSDQKFHFCGKLYEPKLTSHWKTTVGGLERLAKADRIAGSDRTIRYRRFLDDFPVIPMTDRWESVQIGTELTYVVQTSTKVVERCILMTTDPGDLVLDPTCGSGTTAFVAEQWGRRWITIDSSRVALTLARARLMGAKYDYYHLKDTKEGATEEGKLTAKPPADGPFTGDMRQGFVYERAPHVTLKSIANNAEIDVIWERFQKTMEPLRAKLNAALGTTWEEWQVPREAEAKWTAAAKADHATWWRERRERQREIDASIARNADVEYLYDRPIKAKGVVRVAGPFTVESLSPHRVLPLGEDPYLAETLTAENNSVAVDAAPPAPEGNNDFAQVVYDNLLASGVQNTKKGEAIKFEWLKPRVSKSGLVPFEGRYMEGGEQKRAAICIGPEYDTVGYDLVRRAAREAADLYDTLIVCGFAFAPEVDETRLNFGALTVLKARMNQDLRMGDKLKATGAGNLFVIFGEPDLRVLKDDDGLLRVEIKGMDIFDPTTGDVRSSGGSDLKNDVAAWFIDDDYNEESFFVRQAYFVGQDPYDALKRALKAEIDEAAWSEINSTISCSFPRPESGRICVKVINHFGDEVQKVFEV
jgi:adenine-specific DNA-methyltransferase